MWVFAVVFVISFPLTLLAFDTAQVLFSPDEVAAAFSEELVASGVLEEAMVGLILGGELSGSGDVGARALEGALEYIGPGELRDISAALLPPGWSATQVSMIVRDLYAWIDSDAATPDLGLDLRPLKDHLLREGIGELVEIVVDSWPSCSLQEIELLREVQFRLGQLPELICEPPEPMRSELLIIATDYLQNQYRQMPPLLSLAETISDIDQRAEPGELKSVLRLIRAIAEAAWLLPLSLLGLIMALVIRSFPDLTRWWGTPLLLSGAGTFLEVFMVQPIAERMVQRTFSQAAVPGFFGESLFAFTNRLAESISGLLFVHAVVLMVTGGGLLLLGRYLRGRAP